MPRIVLIIDEIPPICGLSPYIGDVSPTTMIRKMLSRSLLPLDMYIEFQTFFRLQLNVRRVTSGYCRAVQGTALRALSHFRWGCVVRISEAMIFRSPPMRESARESRSERSASDYVVMLFCEGGARPSAEKIKPGCSKPPGR